MIVSGSSVLWEICVLLLKKKAAFQFPKHMRTPKTCHMRLWQRKMENSYYPMAQLADRVPFSKRSGLYYQAGFGTQEVKIISQRYSKREEKTKKKNMWIDETRWDLWNAACNTRPTGTRQGEAQILIYTGKAGAIEHRWNILVQPITRAGNRTKTGSQDGKHTRSRNYKIKQETEHRTQRENII